jgi:IS30 family transposase
MAIYSHLTSEIRYQTYALLKAKQTQPFIAEFVGKHKSTISRETLRNTGAHGYRPIHAQRFFDQRKQGKYTGRLSACDWHFIEHLMSDQQWIPEQIALRLKEDGLLEISHETIYQHIILDKQTGGDLHTYLRERVKRRKRYGTGKERRGQIPNQTSIEERPAEAENRDEPGADCEGDLIIGSKHKQAIVTLVDRSTRYTYMKKVVFKTAQAVQEAICSCLSSVKELFRSCTLDNGKEFAQHEEISKNLEGEIYFAHPYSSWERGTNENTNGLIRQYFPRDSDFTTITDNQIAQVQDKLNNRPRKVLNMKTPNELLFGIHPNVALGY